MISMSSIGCSEIQCEKMRKSWNFMKKLLWSKCTVHDNLQSAPSKVFWDHLWFWVLTPKRYWRSLATELSYYLNTAIATVLSHSALAARLSHNALANKLPLCLTTRWTFIFRQHFANLPGSRVAEEYMKKSLTQLPGLFPGPDEL